MAEFAFYEFFCGGGMARAGLGPRWRCAFANDFDGEKAKTYVANWGAAELRVADVATLEAHDLPDRADLAWEQRWGIDKLPRRIVGHQLPH